MINTFFVHFLCLTVYNVYAFRTVLHTLPNITRLIEDKATGSAVNVSWREARLHYSAYARLTLKPDFRFCITIN